MIYQLNKIIYITYLASEDQWIESETPTPIVGYILDENLNFYSSYITPSGREVNSAELILPLMEATKLTLYVYHPYNIYTIRIKLGYTRYVPT